VRAGLERARISGTRSGKAIGRPRKVFDREAILKLRSEGQSFARIAARTHLSVGTISKSSEPPNAAHQSLRRP